MKKLLNAVLLLVSIVSYSQLSNEDLKFIDTSQVVWEETALLEKPDSVIHYWSIDVVGSYEKWSSLIDSSTYRAYEIRTDGLPYSADTIESIFPYSYTYKTDSALNIVGNIFLKDSTSKTNVSRCGTPIYNDYLLVYKGGVVVFQIAQCVSCKYAVVYPNNGYFGYILSGKAAGFIALYGRGFNVFNERIR